MKRVGLFGYYGQHNFGDDLMARLFARTISQWPAECLVFNLGEAPARRYGIATTRSLDELVTRTNLVVYGGGGALIPQAHNHPFSKTMETLLELCQQRSTPLACVSIGGNALPLSKITPEVRRRLLRVSEYASLRNPREAMLLQRDGVQAECHEDVVWTTSQFFPDARPTRRGEDPAHIAVNLYVSSSHESELNEAFESVARSAPATRWSFVESHSFSHEYRQAYQPCLDHAKFAATQFRNVEDGLAFLRRCDLVISNRLHFGLAAMSYGIPFVALMPPPKTLALFEHLGLDSLIWDARDIPRLADLDGLASIREAALDFHQLDVRSCQQDAANHFLKLRDVWAGAASHE